MRPSPLCPQAGKRTEYSIGKFLRRRYGDFLGEYQNGLLSARTTDWPRTKDSMALVLAGLFPPSKHLAWTDVAATGGHHDDDDLGLKWNPIAAESVPRNEDKVRPCTPRGGGPERSQRGSHGLGEANPRTREPARGRRLPHTLGLRGLRGLHCVAGVCDGGISRAVPGRR